MLLLYIVIAMLYLAAGHHTEDSTLCDLGREILGELPPFSALELAGLVLDLEDRHHRLFSPYATWKKRKQDQHCQRGPAKPWTPSRPHRQWHLPVLFRMNQAGLHSFTGQRRVAKTNTHVSFPLQ